MVRGWNGCNNFVGGCVANARPQTGLDATGRLDSPCVRHQAGNRGQAEWKAEPSMDGCLEAELPERKEVELRLLTPETIRPGRSGL